MKSLNYMRAPRPQNMLKCWTIPTDKGDRYYDLPPLGELNAETMQRVKEWDDRLGGIGGGMKIRCGGEDVISLNKA